MQLIQSHCVTRLARLRLYGTLYAFGDYWMLRIGNKTDLIDYATYSAKLGEIVFWTDTKRKRSTLVCKVGELGTFMDADMNSGVPIVKRERLFGEDVL